MANLRLTVLGATALLLAVTHGLTQPPDFRGPGGRSSRGGGGDPSQRGYGRPSRGDDPNRAYGGRSSRDPNESFDRFANGKEVLLKSEMDERMPGFFDRIADTLKITNGQITRQQFVDYSNQRRAERYGGPPPGSEQPVPPAPSAPPAITETKRAATEVDPWGARAEEYFRRLDQNGDGYLNYDELPDDLREDRDRWDTDHNGLIDLNEFKAFFRAKMEQFMVDRGQAASSYSSRGGLSFPSFAPASAPAPAQEERKPQVYRSDNLPKELPPWFKQLDTDHDMQIGLYEWKAAGRSIEEFMRIDRNNDGFLTVDEVLRWQAEEKNNSRGNTKVAGGASFTPSMESGDGSRVPSRGGPSRGPRVPSRGNVGLPGG
jgi:hypothetical protein